ncbi:MAG TPA: hypothetical protein VME41_03160 [Stellaceae bacterium]|nr:hypothetical protein [Stellaceae bacterium]
MADDIEMTVGADVSDAVAAFGDLRQAITAAAQPVAQLKSAFADATSTAASGASRIAQPYIRAFDQIGAGWQRAVAGLVSGTLTWQRAAQRVALSADSGLVGLAGTTLSHAAAGPLASLLGQAAPKAGQGVGDVLGNAVSNWLTGAPQALGGAAATTANAAALAANTTALATLTAALGTATATSGASAVGAVGSAAQVAGGTAELGSAAAGGGGILGFLGGLFAFSAGGIVPSAAGGWVLPSFAGARPALLHAREMVLPAPISEGLQRIIAAGGGDGAAGGGDLHLHFHGPSDGPAVERWFKGLMARSPDVVRSMLRSNALTPRSL